MAFPIPRILRLQRLLGFELALLSRLNIVLYTARRAIQRDTGLNHTSNKANFS
jgi:hypothetical protein